MSVDGRSMLASLLTDQRALEARVSDMRVSPRETLAFGEALLAFAEKETEAFSALAALLDPAAQAELSEEHRQFEEDLELLEWLLRSTPESPDVAVLTRSLLCRMRDHIDRDGRLLARAVGLSART